MSSINIYYVYYYANLTPKNTTRLYLDGKPTNIPARSLPQTPCVHTYLSEVLYIYIFLIFLPATLEKNPSPLPEV